MILVDSHAHLDYIVREGWPTPKLPECSGL